MVLTQLIKKYQNIKVSYQGRNQEVEVAPTHSLLANSIGIFAMALAINTNSHIIFNPFHKSCIRLGTCTYMYIFT